MKRLSAFLLSLIFVFALASCANEKAPKDEVTEGATQAGIETLSSKAESETESPYIEKDGETLNINLSLENTEEIKISHLISGGGDYPTRKIIRDKKTIEKIIKLIGNTNFNICKNQDEIRKPGTTLIVEIDDKISMSFQMDLAINGIYCEEPENLKNDILNIFYEAPEKAEPLK